MNDIFKVVSASLFLIAIFLLCIIFQLNDKIAYEKGRNKHLGLSLSTSETQCELLIHLLKEKDKVLDKDKS